MDILEFLREDLVVLDVQSRSKPDLFREMIGRCVEKGYVKESQEVIGHLLERERLMSTGIKRGFAIPHAFTEQLTSSLMMVGISKEGIDFQALDDEPVFFVFLLLGPPGNQGLHMSILACLSRILDSDDLYGRLEEAESPTRVIEILSDTECQAGR
jgi:mannitol/fructose-specific phosphotransferase system IIA component (Ntr-type)